VTFPASITPLVAFPPQIHGPLTHLTQTLHRLLPIYRHWLRSLQRLRTTYLTPLRRRIAASPWVRKEIAASEAALETAREGLHKRYKSGEMEAIMRDDALRAAKVRKEGRSRSSVLPEVLGGVEEYGNPILSGRAAAAGSRQCAGADGQVHVQVQVQGLGRRGTRVRREHTM
jgi:hypothetical protein